MGEATSSEVGSVNPELSQNEEAKGGPDLPVVLWGKLND